MDRSAASGDLGPHCPAPSARPRQSTHPTLPSRCPPRQPFPAQPGRSERPATEGHLPRGRAAVAPTGPSDRPRPRSPRSGRVERSPTQSLAGTDRAPGRGIPGVAPCIGRGVRAAAALLRRRPRSGLPPGRTVRTERAPRAARSPSPSGTAARHRALAAAGAAILYRAGATAFDRTRPAEPIGVEGQRRRTARTRSGTRRPCPPRPLVRPLPSRAPRRTQP